MLTWMLYVAIVSTLLGVAAWAGERSARQRRSSSRWYWVLTIVASLLLPTVIASVSVQMPNILRQATSPKLIVLREATTVRLPAVLFAQGSTGAAAAVTQTEPMLRSGWIVSSTMLLLALAASAAQVYWRKRRWMHTTMLGTPVYTTEAIGPAVVGLIKPMIVIPKWVLDLPVSQQAEIIAHEKSHISAGDPQLFTVALCLLVLMPWNIPLWWQLRRLRHAIEVDCDTRVLDAGHNARHYGETLIAVCQCQSKFIGAVAAMSESKSLLERRIAIMIRKPAKGWRLVATTFSGLALLCVAVAAQVSPPNLGIADPLETAAKQLGSILLPTTDAARLAQQERLRDPAQRAALKQRFKEARQLHMMPDAGEALGLNQQQLDHMFDVIAETTITRMEQYDPGTEKSVAASDDTMLRTALNMEFGAGFYDKWQAYDQALLPRREVQSLVSNFTDANAALSDLQRQQLTAAYVSAYRDQRASFNANLSSQASKPIDFASAAKLSFSYNAQIQQRVLADATAFLSEPQMAVLRQQLQHKAEMGQAMTKLFGK